MTARRRVVRTVVWVVVAVIVLPLGWLGGSAFIAYDAVTNAQQRAASVPSLLRARDFEALPVALDELTTDTGAAVAATSGPLWDAAAAAPGVGANVRVVRQTLGVVDELAQSAQQELAQSGLSVSVESYLPSNGRMDTGTVRTALTVIADVVGKLHEARAQLDAIDLGGTVPPLRSLVGRVQTLLASADDAATQSFGAAQSAVSGLLGMSGERHDLLLVSDSRVDSGALGEVAAVVELEVVDGSFTLGTAEPVASPPRVAASDPFASVLPATASADESPDFPSVAQAYAQQWTRQHGEPVDDVFAIDTVGLGYLLAVTGSTTADGQPLDASDAVASLAGSGRDAAGQRVLLADAAQEVLTALFAGTQAPSETVHAAGMLYTERRMEAWSSHADEQTVFGLLHLTGVIPADSTTIPVGVYFDGEGATDAASLQPTIGIQSAVCHGARVTVVTVSLATVGTRSTASDPVEVLAYGPAGATLGNATGAQLAAGEVDGHPAVVVEVQPDAAPTTVTFAGGDATGAPVDPHTTARLVGATITLTPSCAAGQ